MPKTITIDSLLGGEEALFATLNGKKKELVDGLERIATEKNAEINAVEQQLITHYLRALPVLFEEAARLMQTVPETPSELLVLRKSEKAFGPPYSCYALFKESNSQLVYIPQEQHKHDSLKEFWKDHGTVTAVKDVLDQIKKEPKDVVEIYQVLKEFVITFRQKKSDAGDLNTGMIKNLEQKIVVSVYGVIEEAVAMIHDDSPYSNIATPYVEQSQEFQFFPSKKAAKEFIQRQKEARLLEKKYSRQRIPSVLTTTNHPFGYSADKCCYSLRKYEFNTTAIPPDLERLLQKPRPVTLPPRKE